jgi:hypothetical protein
MPSTRLLRGDPVRRLPPGVSSRPMADPVASKSTFVVVGVVIVAAAIAYGVVTNWKDKQTTCKLTAAGLAVVADGLTHGHSTARIATDAVGGIVATKACESAVDKLRAEPNSKVKITVSTPGAASTVDIFGSEFRSVGSGTNTCSDWIDPRYAAACTSGEIGPPFLALRAPSKTCDDWLLPSIAQRCRQGLIGPPAS